MEQVARELLICPICLYLPEGPVYSCTNGHSICHRCSRMLNRCPVCRVSYVGTKVRNLALETILENLETDCAYKDAGCLQRIVRKELLEHAAICEKRPISVCKFLGFPNCNFGHSDPARIVVHLQQRHDVESLKVGEPLPIARFEYLSRKFRFNDNLWIARLQDYGHPSEAFVVIYERISQDGGSCTFDCIHFGNPGDLDDTDKRFKVEYTILDLNPEDDFLKWMVTPVSYKLVESFQEKYSFSISTDYLGDHFHSVQPFYALCLAVDFKSKAISGRVFPPQEISVVSPMEDVDHQIPGSSTGGDFQQAMIGNDVQRPICSPNKYRKALMNVPGSYELVSEEGLYEYLCQIGLSMVQRNLMLKAVPTISWTSVSNERWLQTTTTLLKTVENEFTPGEKFEEELIYGDKILSVITFWGPKLVHKQNIPGFGVTYIVREFCGYEMFTTCTAGHVSAKLVFRKLA